LFDYAGSDKIKISGYNYPDKKEKNMFFILVALNDQMIE